MQAFIRYRNGILPNSGGWFDQSAIFNEAIDIIEQELAEIEQAEIEQITEVENDRKRT